MRKINIVMKIKNLLIIAVLAFPFIVSCSSPKTIDLFNGKDLSGWIPVVENDAVPAGDVFWVEDGVIRIAGQPFGYIYTEDVYTDYTLDVEWSWPGEPANSGIFLIIADPTNPFPNGVECQLKAGSAGDFVLLGGSDLKEYELPADGVRPQFPVKPRFAASSELPAGEWNHAKIIVEGGHITVYVNDVLQNEGTDPCTSGHIGLQSEGGPIAFRSVKITPAK